MQPKYTTVALFLTIALLNGLRMDGHARVNGLSFLRPNSLNCESKLAQPKLLLLLLLRFESSSVFSLFVFVFN